MKIIFVAVLSLATCFTISNFAFAFESSSTNSSKSGNFLLLLDPAKHADGSLWQMSQYEAIEYCAKQDHRLPTARELAIYTMGLGAKGIADASQGKPDNSYELVEAEQTEDTSEGFYFSTEGFRKPVGSPARDNWLWSSSRGLDFLRLPFVLDGGNGRLIQMNNYEARLAVRCVAEVP